MMWFIFAPKRRSEFDIFESKEEALNQLSLCDEDFVIGELTHPDKDKIGELSNGYGDNS